jgi:hypothetical protein
LISKIEQAAKANGADWSVREGGNHTVGLLNGQIVPIPRHREIEERTARSIFKQCENALGKEWWRK